jgi:hypothetical protein
MKDGKVVCPNADKPGVWKTAQENYEKWLSKKTKGCTAKKRSEDKPIDFNKLSDDNKRKMTEAVLASMQPRTPQANQASKGDDSVAPCKEPIIFVADVVVLSSMSGSRDILPAPIVSNFPHILLQFGTKMGCSNCPVVRFILDTAAALSTGTFISLQQ